MHEAELKVRKLLAEDFAVYAEKFVKIRNKAGDFVPFRLNKVQRDFLAAMMDQLARTGKIRIVICKARQQGFSTFMQAFTYWWASHRKTKKAYVVANDRHTTGTLFKQLTDTHKAMDPRLQPRVERANVRQLLFGDLNTMIEIDTAGGDAVGRGQTLNLLWGSELAHWPEDTAADNLMALLQAVPNEPGSVVVFESTAKGVTGPYYDLYHGAPGNGFETFFAPWYDSAEYCEHDYPEDFGQPRSPYEYTIEEINLRAKYNLTDAQLWWRRTKLAGPGGRPKFDQEYPTVEDDAFQNSGAPVFASDALSDQRGAALPVLESMNYNIEEDKFEEAFNGKLVIYEQPKKGERYYIGVDVAHGTTSGDYSVAQVLDGNRRQVARYRGHIGAREYAGLLYRLGMMFNEAEIAIEVNGIGHTTAQWLAHHHGYPSLWRRILDTKAIEERSDNLGFVTNLKTKPQVISHLADELRIGGIKINDSVTLDEMRTFIRTGKRQDRLEASAGKHDDCVMALAIASYINKGNWQPIEMTDDWYVRAI